MGGASDCLEQLMRAIMAATSLNTSGFAASTTIVTRVLLVVPVPSRLRSGRCEASRMQCMRGDVAALPGGELFVR